MKFGIFTVYSTICKFRNIFFRDSWMDSFQHRMKNFFMGFNLQEWWNKGALASILLFLVFNIILLSTDVFLDIITCVQFFISGDILWALINLYMIFNPFILRFLSNFVAELKAEKTWWSNLKILFSWDKIKHLIVKSSPCLPIVQTIENLTRMRQMLT